MEFIWKLVLVGIVLVVVFIVGYTIVKESPKKYYRKARRLHKEGEASYEVGEFEEAKELYQEADAARKKARELEQNGMV